MVLTTKEYRKGEVKTLNVHGFEPAGAKVWKAPKTGASYVNQSAEKLKSPWKDIISIDTLIVNFAPVEKSNKISVKLKNLVHCQQSRNDTSHDVPAINELTSERLCQNHFNQALHSFSSIRQCAILQHIEAMLS